MQPWPSGLVRPAAGRSGSREGGEGGGEPGCCSWEPAAVQLAEKVPPLRGRCSPAAPGPVGCPVPSARRALAAPRWARCGARAEMGSLREEDDEESRSERRSAGLEPAVGVSAALEVTPEGSALTLRGGGSRPAAVGAAGRPRLSAPASSACRWPASPGSHRLLS